MGRVLTVTTVYGNNTFVDQCQRDLVRSTLYPHDRLIFNDKASDQSISFLTALAKETQSVLQYDRTNIGVSKLLNRVTKEYLTQYDYFVILNDDVGFPDPEDGKDWLGSLIEFAESNDLAACSPDWFWVGHEVSNPLQYFKSVTVGWSKKPIAPKGPGVQGYCWVIKSATIKELIERDGYFANERIWFSWLDCEIVWRIHRRCNKKTAVANIPFYHWGSKTVGELNKNPSELPTEYFEGRAIFFGLANPPSVPDVPHQYWEVSNSIYCYREDPSQPWKLWI